MKKLISFSGFVFVLLMLTAAGNAQAQVIVRAFAPYPVVAGVGFGAYPRPYCRGGYYRCAPRYSYPVAMGYYPGPRYYGRRAGFRARVW